MEGREEVKKEGGAEDARRRGMDLGGNGNGTDYNELASASCLLRTVSTRISSVGLKIDGCLRWVFIFLLIRFSVYSFVKRMC